MQIQDRMATFLAASLFVLMAGLTAGGMAWSGNQPTTIWTLEDGGGRTECLTRPVPDGVEIQLVSNGEPVYRRVFKDGEDALQFAEDARQGARAERPAFTWSAPSN